MDMKAWDLAEWRQQYCGQLDRAYRVEDVLDYVLFMLEQFYADHDGIGEFVCTAKMELKKPIKPRAKYFLPNDNN